MSAQDEKKIAAGGAIVFAAGIADRGMRLVVTWVLSSALGSALFGSYTFAVTIASVITVLTPLGLDVGAVYFGAQHHSKGEKQELKGLILSGTALTIASGLIGTLLLWFLAPFWFSNPEPIQWIAPAIALWTPLLFMVGLLRAVKDMRGNAIAFQLALPAALMTGACSIWLFDWGIEAALTVFSLSLAVGLVTATWHAYRHFRALLKSREIPPKYAVGTHLKYALPQGMAAMVFRLNIWMDILMLGVLAPDKEIGLYKIAASLALLGGLPISALTAIFNPFIAQLSGSGELKRLNSLLKTTTRWLCAMAFPILIGLALAPDLALMLFNPEYQASQNPLLILVAGQVTWIACALAMRLIPMSGHTTLNLINGIIALVLNLMLNHWLIPIHGGIGAAMATAITLSAWSLWRLVEVWWLLKCFPFTKSTLTIIIGFTGLTIFAMIGLQGTEIAIRFICAIGLIGAFILASFTLAGETADREVIAAIKKRIKLR